MSAINEKCIGCWFSTKKKKKVNLKRLRQLVESYGCSLQEIEFSRGLDGQGPFDAIIHKMTDRMIEAMDGNKKAEKNMEDVENYLLQHPRTIVVDPLPSIRKLLDRHETYTLIRSTRLCQSGRLNIPTFALIASKKKSDILRCMKEHNVEFPFVCKKSIAHGSASHKPDDGDVMAAKPLDTTILDALTKELHSELKMTMYGIDVIASTETGKHYAIDVNVFPGYDGVPDFLDTLVEHVMGELGRTQCNGAGIGKSGNKVFSADTMGTNVSSLDSGVAEPQKKVSRLDTDIPSTENGKS